MRFGGRWVRRNKPTGASRSQNSHTGAARHQFGTDAQVVNQIQKLRAEVATNLRDIERLTRP